MRDELWLDRVELVEFMKNEIAYHMRNPNPDLVLIDYQSGMIAAYRRMLWFVQKNTFDINEPEQGERTE